MLSDLISCKWLLFKAFCLFFQIEIVYNSKGLKRFEDVDSRALDSLLDYRKNSSASFYSSRYKSSVYKNVFKTQLEQPAAIEGEFDTMSENSNNSYYKTSESSSDSGSSGSSDSSDNSSNSSKTPKSVNSNSKHKGSSIGDNKSHSSDDSIFFYEKENSNPEIMESDCKASKGHSEDNEVLIQHLGKGQVFEDFFGSVTDENDSHEGDEESGEFNLNIVHQFTLKNRDIDEFKSVISPLLIDLKNMDLKNEETIFKLSSPSYINLFSSTCHEISENQIISLFDSKTGIELLDNSRCLEKYKGSFQRFAYKALAAIPNLQFYKLRSFDTIKPEVLLKYLKNKIFPRYGYANFIEEFEEILTKVPQTYLNLKSWIEDTEIWKYIGITECYGKLNSKQIEKYLSYVLSIDKFANYERMFEEKLEESRLKAEKQRPSSVSSVPLMKHRKLRVIKSAAESNMTIAYLSKDLAQWSLLLEKLMHWLLGEESNLERDSRVHLIEQICTALIWCQKRAAGNDILEPFVITPKMYSLRKFLFQSHAFEYVSSSYWNNLPDCTETIIYTYKDFLRQHNGQYHALVEKTVMMNLMKAYLFLTMPNQKSYVDFMTRSLSQIDLFFHRSLCYLLIHVDLIKTFIFDHLKKSFNDAISVPTKEVLRWIKASKDVNLYYLLEFLILSFGNEFVITEEIEKILADNYDIRGILYLKSNSPVIKLMCALDHNPCSNSRDGSSPIPLKTEYLNAKNALLGQENDLRINKFLEISLDYLSRNQNEIMSKEFKIEIINEPGLFGGGLTKAWLLSLLTIFGDPARNLFPISKNGVGRYPAPFLKPSIMGLLGLLHGKALQLGIRPPWFFTKKFSGLILFNTEKTISFDKQKKIVDEVFSRIMTAFDSLSKLKSYEAVLKFNNSKYPSKDLFGDSNIMYQSFESDSFLMKLKSFQGKNEICTTMAEILFYRLDLTRALFRVMMQGQRKYLRSLSLYFDEFFRVALRTEILYELLHEPIMTADLLLSYIYFTESCSKLYIKNDLQLVPSEFEITAESLFKSIIRCLSDQEIAIFLKFTTGRFQVPLTDLGFFKIKVECDDFCRFTTSQSSQNIVNFSVNIHSATQAKKKFIDSIFEPTIARSKAEKS